MTTRPDLPLPVRPEVKALADARMAEDTERRQLRARLAELAGVALLPALRDAVDSLETVCWNPFT